MWGLHTLVVLELTHMVIKWRHVYAKVTSPCEIASQRIQGLLEAYFKIEKQWWARKRIHYTCEGRIEKSVPRDHQFSTLGKPRDAKPWSLGRNFYPTLTPMIHVDSYILTHVILPRLSHYSDVIMLTYDTLQLILELLGALFNIKMWYLMVIRPSRSQFASHSW